MGVKSDVREGKERMDAVLAEDFRSTLLLPQLRRTSRRKRRRSSASSSLEMRS